jgi:hypothetical protein
MEKMPLNSFLSKSLRDDNECDWPLPSSMQPSNSNVLRMLRGLSSSATGLWRAELVLSKPNICNVTVAAASIQIQLSHFLTLPTKNNSTFTFRVTMNLANHIGLKKRKEATLLKTTFAYCSNCCYFVAVILTFSVSFPENFLDPVFYRFENEVPAV